MASEKIVDESGFEWQVVREADAQRVIVDRDGIEWTVPTPSAIEEMRAAVAPAAQVEPEA